MERARDCPSSSRGPEGRVGRECDNQKVGEDLLWRRLQGESVDCSCADLSTIELAKGAGQSVSGGRQSLQTQESEYLNPSLQSHLDLVGLPLGRTGGGIRKVLKTVLYFRLTFAERLMALPI